MDSALMRFLVRDSGRLPQAEPVFTHFRETLEVVRVARFLDEVLCGCSGALIEGRLSKDDFLAEVRAIREVTQALRQRCTALEGRLKSS